MVLMLAGLGLAGCGGLNQQEIPHCDGVAPGVTIRTVDGSRRIARVETDGSCVAAPQGDCAFQPYLRGEGGEPCAEAQVAIHTDTLGEACTMTILSVKGIRVVRTAEVKEGSHTMICGTGGGSSVEWTPNVISPHEIVVDFDHPDG